MNYFIVTFGCQQNRADSERIQAAFKARGFTKARSIETAHTVVINTCMVRESAENRVFGLVNNLAKIKKDRLKIIVTGCMVGGALRDKTGKYLSKLRNKMPAVDEFMSIEEVGFNLPPVRSTKTLGLVPISNGCNNFCTFCIVPFTRGREVSRPFADIISECNNLLKKGYTEVMLLGQNVNSYGADLVVGTENVQVMRDLDKTYFNNSPLNIKKMNSNLKFHISNSYSVKPVFVKHLGRYRLPTLFPYLLEEVAKLGFKKIDFMSSNPWDFSEELIQVIATYPNITRTLHIAVQSGDNSILQKMNRWYTREEFLSLVRKLKSRISHLTLTTDIIVGFPGETEEAFQNTVSLCKEIGFMKAYISRYSSRPFTAATKVLGDTVPASVKKRRWQELDRIVNFAAYR